MTPERWEKLKTVTWFGDEQIEVTKYVESLEEMNQKVIQEINEVNLKLESKRIVSKTSFEESIKRAEEAINIISDHNYCAGLCEVMKSDMPAHHWVEQAKIVDGVCSKCHKKRNPLIGKNK